jgi:hypothetical protein
MRVERGRRLVPEPRFSRKTAGVSTDNDGTDDSDSAFSATAIETAAMLASAISKY